MLKGHQPSAATGPRLRRGLVTVPVRQGLLVDGASRRHLFTGAAAASVLPKLLPLLDGRHDAAALSAELRLRRPDVEHVLDLLGSRGLLEAVGGAQPAGTGSASVMAYFSRTLHAAAGYSSAEDLLDELAAATVLICAPREVAEPGAADLRETGVGTVICREASGLGPAALHLRDESACLALVLDDPDHPAALAGAAAALGERGIPVLRCAAAGCWAEIGPLFHPRYSACVACFRHGYADLAATQQAPAGLTEARAGLLAALLVTEALALIAGTSAPASLRTLVRHSVSGLATERHLVLPDRDCRHCHGDAAPRTAVPDGAWHALDYEWQMETPPPLTRPARRGARAVGPPQEAAFGWPRASAPKEHSCLPYRDLSDLPVRPLRPGPLAGAGHGDLAGSGDLAGILMRVGDTGAGAAPADRQEQPFSIGQPEGLELYALSGSGLFGLPGSVFRYDSARHRLYSVHKDQIPLSECLADTDLEPGATSCCLVLVAAVSGLAAAHGNFAFRLAHLQAGSAAARLLASAGGLGLSVWFASYWPPHLADLLDLRPGQQIVTALAGISCRPREPACR